MSGYWSLSARSSSVSERAAGADRSRADEVLRTEWCLGRGREGERRCARRDELRLLERERLLVILLDRDLDERLDERCLL